MRVKIILSVALSTFLISGCGNETSKNLSKDGSIQPYKIDRMVFETVVNSYSEGNALFTVTNLY